MSIKRDEITMNGPITRPDWHGWSLHPNIPALIYTGGRHPGYRIDFDQLLTAGDVLNWIVQIFGKAWDPGALDGFVNALDEILDPQKTMCREPGFNPRTVRERVAAFVAEVRS